MTLKGLHRAKVHEHLEPTRAPIASLPAARSVR